GRECKVPTQCGRNRLSILSYSKSSRLASVTEARSSGRFEISRVIAAAGRYKPGASPGFVSRRTHLKSLFLHRKGIQQEIPDTALIPLSLLVSFWKPVSLSRLARPPRALRSARPRVRGSQLIRSEVAHLPTTSRKDRDQFLPKLCRPTCSCLRRRNAPYPAPCVCRDRRSIFDYQLRL